MHLVPAQSARSAATGNRRSIGARPVNLDLPPNLAHEIGLIVTHWSYLESQIDQIILYLLRVRPKNEPVAALKLPLAARLNLAHQLIIRSGAISTRDFAALKTDILRVKQERDRVLGGTWVWDTNTWAHYPSLATDGNANAPGHAGRPRTKPLSPEKLTFAKAKAVRVKVDFLNPRAKGLFHALVKAHPEHIKTPLRPEAPGLPHGLTGPGGLHGTPLLTASAMASSPRKERSARIYIFSPQNKKAAKASGF